MHPYPGRASSLSLDILETIFMFAISDSDDDDARYPLLRRAPFNLSRVNRHWQWVTMGRNVLWTTMKSVIESASDMRHTARDLAFFETCLSRCGPSLPLTISVLFDPIANWNPETRSEEFNAIVNEAAKSMCEYMSLIMPVRYRLRTAHLCFRLEAPDAPSPGIWPWHIDNMPELEHLKALYPFIGADDEPGVIDLSACNERIRTCDIAGCLEIRIAAGLTFSNLEVLKLNIPGNCKDTWALTRSWYNALARMPKLSRLLVDIHEGMTWDFHPGFYIQLPKLEELGVRFTTEVEDQFNEVPFEFINNIYCPHLKDLSITCDYPDKPEERSGFDFHVAPIGFYEFLIFNGNELERLVIGYDLFSESEFLNALVRCTNLRQLHFRDMRFADNSELLKVLHLERRLEWHFVRLGENNTRPYCPKLECLIVSRCCIPSSIKPSDIADMIVGRREKEGSKFECFGHEGFNVEGVGEDPKVKDVCEVIEDEEVS